MRRRAGGVETWSRLQQWSQGSAQSERLAAHVLRAEGFESIDPTHPLGGPDRLRDIICERVGERWRAAAYFPRGQKQFPAVVRKFKKDLGDIREQGDEGFAFLTNQELRLSERKSLSKLAASRRIEVFHLERITSILDSPIMYGVRLEFLDIEMTREEQVAFFAEMHSANARLAADFRSFVQQIRESGFLDQEGGERRSTCRVARVFVARRCANSGILNAAGLHAANGIATSPRCRL
jgi:hypothetical protein